ncbi:hypothetical protein B566_EDAN014050 [Ephemera danica]|nr:hypothetical protein B566_EDAN014050 [Ephemera danica]
MIVIISLHSGDQLPEETTFDYNDNFEEDSSVNHLPAIPEFVSLPLPSEITTKYGPAGFSTVQRQQVQELSNPSECKKKTGCKQVLVEYEPKKKNLRVD